MLGVGKAAPAQLLLHSKSNLRRITRRPTQWGPNVGDDLRLRAAGYETGERSSLGLEPERRRRRMQRGRRCAAVEKIEDQRKPDDFFAQQET